VITVTPRARSREDRAGDPLDGLVNLFDLGIVLSVAFLLAALSSHNLTGLITKAAPAPAKTATVPLAPGQTLHQIPVPSGAATGPGVPVGTVYRLPDGRLVYVTGKP
jgi:hypothetical protein